MTKLLPYVIMSLLRGESPKVSSATREPDWAYFEDVVDAMLMLATSGYMDGRTINLGSGRLTSIRSIVESVVRGLGPNVAVLNGVVPDQLLDAITQRISRRHAD